jgi:hypothetical protein
MYHYIYTGMNVKQSFMSFIPLSNQTVLNFPAPKIPLYTKLYLDGYTSITFSTSNTSP